MTAFVVGVFTGILAFIIAILVATKIGYTLVFTWDDSKVKVVESAIDSAKVRQVLLDEFGAEETEAIDALMERMK